MLTIVTSDGWSPNPKCSIMLPEGLRGLAKRCQKIVFKELKAGKLSVESLSVFHVEPRGTSFLFGFRVELVSGDEIFVYVEPDARLDSPLSESPVPGGNSPIALWQYPFDPKLKALATVVNTEPLGIVLSRLNLDWVPSTAVLLTYRPGRRAVVRCSQGSRTAFVKAMRPQTAGRVIAAARLAQASDVCTPGVIGWSPAGIAIYEPSNGIELSRGNVFGVPAAVAVSTAFEALSRLERVETKASSRRPIINNTSWYFARATQAHPAEETALRKLEEKIQSMKLRNRESEKAITIHGDLHLGQLFVTEDETHSLSGIIDLDDMGLGYVVDDVAGMWANCIASDRLTKVNEESQFWRECTKTLENWRLPPTTDFSRLYSSIAVHLVAQTLSTRGLDPAIAHTLIQDAALQLK